MKLWKKIHPRYSISKLGQIKNDKTGRILKTGLSKGYLHVTLCFNGERKMAKIHRLVAKAFIGACPKGLQTNHIDGNKLNNHYKNLEYVTGKQNIHHARKLGIAPNRAAAKLSHKQVTKIRSLLRNGQDYSRLAILFSVKPSAIKNIDKGITWKD